MKLHNLEKIKTIIINENESMKSALTLLESAALKILLVVSDSEKFQGVLTDGDIRTALLSGYELSSKIKFFKNADCITVNEGENPLDVSRQNKTLSEFPYVSVTEILRVYI